MYSDNLNFQSINCQDDELFLMVYDIILLLVMIPPPRVHWSGTSSKCSEPPKGPLMHICK